MKILPTTYNKGQGKEEDGKIQKAKDYLWQFIDEHNKELLIASANSGLLGKHDLELKRVVIGYEYK